MGGLLSKPVYLECTVTGAGASYKDGRPGLLHVVLNEDESTAGYSFGDGMPPLIRAVFKPAQVTWEDESVVSMRPSVLTALANGATNLTRLAEELNGLGSLTREGSTWSPGTVQRLVFRLQLDYRSKTR